MKNNLVEEPTEGRSIQIGPIRSTIMARGVETGGRYALIEHTIPANTSGPPLHVHRHYDHAWYILEGEIEFTCGDKIIPGRNGTFIFVPRGTNHTYTNIGSNPARILEIDSPGGLEHYIEELGSATTEGASIDLQTLAAIQRRYDTHSLLQ